MIYKVIFYSSYICLGILVTGVFFGKIEPTNTRLFLALLLAVNTILNKPEEK